MVSCVSSTQELGDQDPQPTQTSPLPRVRRGRGWPPSAPQGPLTCRGWTEGRPKPRPPRPLPFLGRGGGGCLLCLCMACTRYNVTVLSRAPPAAEANDPAVPVRTPAGPPGPPPSRAAEGSHRLPMQRGQAERLQCSAGAGPRKRPFLGVLCFLSMENHRPSPGGPVLNKRVHVSSYTS